MVKTLTVIEEQVSKKSHISEVKFRRVLKCFSVDIPATSAAVLFGLHRKTPQRIYPLLRARIVELAIQEARPFVGDIEVDENYFGAKRIRGKRGRGAGGNTPVLGLHKRQGRVFVSVVQNLSNDELMPIPKGRIVEGSDVYTDGWKAYDGLVTNGYRHHRIHHHQNEFARGKTHVNGIESFWSFAKFRMAKLRGVRKENS